MTLPHAASPTAEFPVTWDDPSEAELTWERDDMHMPHAVAPLTADYISVIGQGYGYCAMRFDAPLEFIAGSGTDTPISRCAVAGRPMRLPRRPRETL